MESLQAFFDNHSSNDIHVIGKYVQQHINDYWQSTFEQAYPKMAALYEQIGDSAYGMYGATLFHTVHEQFKHVGLRATPKLPGSLNSSREWGNDESERQRWMWSKITTVEGAAVGTLVIVVYHDHTQIRIPRSFDVIALEESTPKAILEALSRHSTDFAGAMDMKTEVALYYS